MRARRQTVSPVLVRRCRCGRSNAGRTCRLGDHEHRGLGVPGRRDLVRREGDQLVARLGPARPPGRTASNPSPCMSTVSMPTWMSSSAPLGQLPARRRGLAVRHDHRHIWASAGRVDRAARRLERHAFAHHALREHLVRHLGKRQGAAVANRFEYNAGRCGYGLSRAADCAAGASAAAGADTSAAAAGAASSTRSSRTACGCRR